MDVRNCQTDLENNKFTGNQVLISLCLEISSNTVCRQGPLYLDVEHFMLFMITCSKNKHRKCNSYKHLRSAHRNIF